MVMFIFIGIIDSGLGGMSCLNELINQHKYYEYILYLDYKSNPYGTKSEDELLNRLNKAISFLKNKGCNKIIIACNTLSIVAIKHNIKDVITPINFFKKVIKDNFDDSSILIATNFTIKENIYDVNGKESSDLVSYIEGNKPLNIKEYLAEFNKYNKIFLGCTHFNLLKKHFKDKKIYDSGKALIDNIIIENKELKVTIYLTKINTNIYNHLIKNIHLQRFDIKII
mgnify:CR=1 FL=1